MPKGTKKSKPEISNSVEEAKSDGNPNTAPSPKSTDLMTSKGIARPAKDSANDTKGKISPEFSLTKSKKGIIHIWVKLPRSVPQSCLNMDATETHFHLDTKKWGSNYEIDIPYPANTTVILKEGEEAEAEFQGGMLRVRIKTTESEQPWLSQGPRTKRASSDSAGGGILKKQRLQEPQKKQEDGTNSKTTGKEKTNNKRVKTTTQQAELASKESCLKLIEEISHVQETKIQDKLKKEKDRDEALEKIEDVRKKRKEDKMSRKEDLVKKLKASKVLKSHNNDSIFAEEMPPEANKSAKGPAKRVSWGAD